MIVKMKKIILIAQSKDIDSTLESVRKLGLLHVEHENSPVNENIEELKEKLNRVSKAIAILPDIKNQGILNNKEDSFIDEINSLLDEKETVIEDLQILERDIETWKEWGDFDPNLIEDLEDNKVWVRLCKVTAPEMKNIPEGVALEKLFKKGNIIYCAAVSRKDIKLPFETLELPEIGVEEMLFKEKRYKARILEIEKRFMEIAAYKDALRKYENYLNSLIEFNEAREGAGRFEKLSYIKGYSPIDKVNLIETAASKEKWGIIIADPLEEEVAPTLIRTPRWVSIIQPIFKLLEIVPGYRELDISPLFLIFLSLFFGMIIGDAGYGLVYFLLTALAQNKLSGKVQAKVFFLFYLFSSCAIFWGIITGTFFGQEWYLNAGMKPLIPVLNNTKILQAFCFFVGAFHLSLAHAWRAMVKFPSLAALADIGWITLLWAGFFLAEMLILGDPFPFFGKWLIIGGIALTILFSDPQKNILKTIASGLATVALSLVNSFTDVVSYIRLFAVGLAGVAIADTINMLANILGGENFIIKVLILLLGHTINIVLGPISVLVHGIRLNVLEFSGHANISWSGIAYKPFKS